MMDSLLKRIENNKKAHGRWIALVLCLSMLVSLGTFAGFRKTAVAKVYTREVLDCPYTHEGAEPVAHVHNDDCYDGDTLVCTLPELEAHTHSDACYTERQVLTCTLEENPGHQHTDACYVEHKVQSCGLEENPGHVHNGTCYNESGVLICQIPEGEGAHTHTDDCYTVERELTCAIPEGEGAHTHSAECFETVRELTCGKAELTPHVHGPECIRTEEITVDEPEESVEPEVTAQPEATTQPEATAAPEMPVSDPNADLESASDWERDFDGMELSGNWAKDLVLVAATQQGHGESQNNFEAVLNDAGDAWVRHGYTRYGAWSGAPYADEWSAMFVSFCLRYAGIPAENVPNNPTAALMAESFQKGELFAGPDYLPAVGDLIFFDTDDEEGIDHMGIVYHVDEENGSINAVEGARTDAVETFGYKLDDEEIAGYGILPQNPDYIPTEEENNDDEEKEEEKKETEEVKPVEETKAAEEVTAPAVPMPAQSWERTAGGIKVTVDAPEGAFPENTKIAVTPVNGNSLKDTVSDAVNGEVLEVQAVDITFFDADGNEIEPALPIRVIMTPAETQNAEEKTNVVHIDLDQQTAEVIEQAAGTETDNSEVVFDADAFTIYAIVYTYDVHYEYEVNGKTFTSASMPGAENMTLAKIVEGLGIVDETEIDVFVSKIASVTSTNEEVAVVEKTEDGLHVRVLKDGEAQIVITMQDGAQFHVDVMAEGETSASNETATVSTVGELYLPAEAELKTEVLDEVKSESAVTAVKAAEGNTDDSAITETAYQVFDISLENVKTDEYKEGFNVTVALDSHVTGKDFHLYHIHDGVTTDITETLELDSRADENGTLNVRGFSFQTDNFSEFVLSYTVDFYYGEYSFSINGGEKITLSELAGALGINNAEIQSVEDFIAKVSNVEFSDEQLIKVVHPETDITVQQAVTELGVEQVFSVWLDEGEREQILSDTIHANEWALISLLPFNTEEKLTITMNSGEEVIVRVTDDAISQQSGSDNLSSFLLDASVTNVENGDSVKVGRTYSMHLKFAEMGDSQLSTTEPLTYKVPDGIKMVQQSGTFNVTYAGTSYSGNTFTYDESTNTITVNFSDTVKALVAKSPDAQFEINMNGQFTGEKSHFEFSEAIIKDYIIDNDHDVTVNKSGSYRSDDNKVHYTVTASSDGRSDHVVITDTVTGTALNYDRGSIQVNGNSAPYKVEETENGFVVRLDSMNDQETVTVTYTASVDFDSITGKGTVTQTGNTVKIEADNDPGEEKPTDVSNQIDYNPLSKSAGTVSGDGNTKTIPWTITVNERQLKSVAGSTITDHNNSRDVMKYSGTGITIAVMDGTRTVRTITKTWAELGVDDPSTAATWSYKLPETDDDLNNTYKYVITYETTVDASGKITDFSVNNGVSDDEGHNGGGGTNVTPGDDKITLEKTNDSYSAATSEWEISFNVPKEGLSSAVVTDRFPEKWATSHWIDTLTGDIVIEGLLDEESYSIDTSSESQVVITFYKTGEKTAANQGLQASESERTVIVKLSTENNPEWVQALTGDTHTNTASLNVNGQVVTDTANSNPRSEGIAKTGSFEGTTNIEGREYPVFKYTLNLYDVSDQSFDKSNKLTITDTYNGEYLRLWVKTEQEDWGELRWSWPNNNHAYQDSRTTWTDNNGTLTITADKSEFVRDDNGLYNSVYQIYYYLIVKDMNTLDNLESVSIGTADHKVPIENTATWGTFHDKVTIDYEYPGVDKEQLGHADSKGMVKYKIVLNPDKQTLNNGNPMEMQDSATNISVDYSTIVIESDPAADITYYYRGYTGYYTIPDKTKVTITYSARVVGDGQVPISNDAVMKGFKDSTSSTETGSNSGSGNLNIDWVVVYKHEWRKMEKGLNDAVYVLTDEAGNPILYPASAKNGLVGQPVTFKTGTIDLNALPDGTRLAEEQNMRDGYAWMYLDKDQTGLAFQKGITYYFKEYEAPPGYQKSDTIFTFRISEHPDYDDWEYYKGDILRLADSEVEGNLQIRKTFVGAENLTDTQKKQITFKITAVDNSGNPIRIPYTKDKDDNNVYADESGLEISYADFVNGGYKLENLPNGTYTVQETNSDLGGYTHISTTYTVDGEAGTEASLAGSVKITDKTAHTFEYVNTYGEEDAHIRIVKKDAAGQISLYGATFQLFKKNDNGDYEAVADHAGLTANGEFTIDYDNRDSGVTITGLETGDYYIKETKAPTDYQLDETPFYFSVNAKNKKVTGEQHGNNVTFENDSNEKNLVATVTDKISHTYTLTKVDEFRLSKKLNGAEFTVAELTGFNSEGAIVPSETKYWTYTTGEDGTFVIDADELSLETNKVYVIWETKAPAGYEINSKIYAFYLGETSVVQTVLIKLRSGYPDASIVSLANGPQKTTVPNKEQSMDLYAYKQWYKVDGTKDKDLVSWITEIEVQLFRVVTDSHGTVISDAAYPDAETTYTLSQGAGGNSSYLDYKWEDLPTGYSVNTNNPLTYTYYIKEVVPEGYEARYVLGTGGGNSLTDTENVHAEASDITVGADSTVKTVQIRNSPEVLNLQMEKVWLDDGSHWNNNNVTFHIRYTDNTHTRENPGQPNNADLGGSYKVDPQLPGDSNVEGNRYAYRWPTLAPWTDNDPSNPRTYFVLEDSGHVSNMQNAGYGEPTYSIVETETGEKIVITNKKTQSDKLQVKKIWMNADGTAMSDAEISDLDPVTVQLQKEEGVAGEGYSVSVQIHNQYGDTGTKTFTVAKNGKFEFILGAGNWASLNENQSSLAGGSFTGSGQDRTFTLNTVTKDTHIYVFFEESWANLPDDNKYTFDAPMVDWSGTVTDVSTEDNINGITSDNVRVTLSGDNNWTYQWPTLTAPSEKTYRYFVREVEVPAGFEVSYENNDGIQTGIMYVKNTVSEYTRALARKAWLDASGNLMPTPPEGATVTFALYQNGKIMSKRITLDGTVDGSDEEGGEREPWVAIWEGLERYDADGAEYVYTIKEYTGFPGYTAMKLDNESTYVVMKASDSIASGETIYNKKVRSITVTKIWNNADGENISTNVIGQNSVTVNLYDSTDLTKPVKSITLDGRTDVNGEQSAWVATFSNLDDSKTYLVNETELPPGFRMVSYTVDNNPKQDITENQNDVTITAGNGDSNITLINQETEKTIDFEFTKEWQNMTGTSINWTEGATISVTVKRKIGVSGDSEEVGSYTITKTSDGFNINKSENAPELANEQRTDKFKLSKLPENGTIGNDTGLYTYFAVETETVYGYNAPTYSNPSVSDPNTWTPSEEGAMNGGKIINKEAGGYELPQTGGIGTTLFTALGGLMTGTAGAILTMKSWHRRKENA